MMMMMMATLPALRSVSTHRTSVCITTPFRATPHPATATPLRAVSTHRCALTFSVYHHTLQWHNTLPAHPHTRSEWAGPACLPRHHMMMMMMATAPPPLRAVSTHHPSVCLTTPFNVCKSNTTPFSVCQSNTTPFSECGTTPFKHTHTPACLGCAAGATAPPLLSAPWRRLQQVY